MLVGWLIWKYRNKCVFDGMSPSTQRLLQSILTEAAVWRTTGSKELDSLLS
uniref:Uncharacterized protein n=1 Tax=Arundo donax TaxID=35708 RepID=A0A0A8YAF9_ARUDO